MTRRSTAALILLALGLCGPGLAQGLSGAALLPGAAIAQTCRVATIDSVATNFGCRGRTGDHLYWVTRATRFRTRLANGSFFDVRSGEWVQVISHHSGNLDIADVVML